MVRRALVHEAGCAQDQRRVDDVAVACDPAGIGRAPVAVLLLEVEHPGEGRADENRIAAVGVQKALGFAGGAGGVEDEERVLGVHDLGLTMRRSDRQRHQVVIPVVAAGFHVDLLAGALDHDHVLDDGRAVDRFVGHLLEVDRLAAQPGAVGRDQHSALRVLDAVGQGLFAKAAVDHGVHRAELGAGEHRDHQLGDAAHVDRHPVAFVHAHAAQDVGELVGLAIEPQVAVADLVARLALPDQGQLVLAPGLDVAVERVERDIGLAARNHL